MLKTILTPIAGAILLILGFMFSVVVIATVAVVGLAVWSYFWWKTRKLRQVVREHTTCEVPANGHTIEGESVIVEEHTMDTSITLPDKPTATGGRPS